VCDWKRGHAALGAVVTLLLGAGTAADTRDAGLGGQEPCSRISRRVNTYHAHHARRDDRRNSANHGHGTAQASPSRGIHGRRPAARNTGRQLIVRVGSVWAVGCVHGAGDRLLLLSPTLESPRPLVQRPSSASRSEDWRGSCERGRAARNGRPVVLRVPILDCASCFVGRKRHSPHIVPGLTRAQYLEASRADTGASLPYLRIESVVPSRSVKGGGSSTSSGNIRSDSLLGPWAVVVSAFQVERRAPASTMRFPPRAGCDARLFAPLHLRCTLAHARRVPLGY
jgi:hypothetical protein